MPMTFFFFPVAQNTLISYFLADGANSNLQSASFFLSFLYDPRSSRKIESNSNNFNEMTQRTDCTFEIRRLNNETRIFSNRDKFSFLCHGSSKKLFPSAQNFFFYPHQILTSLFPPSYTQNILYLTLLKPIFLFPYCFKQTFSLGTERKRKERIEYVIRNMNEKEEKEEEEGRKEGKGKPTEIPRLTIWIEIYTNVHDPLRRTVIEEWPVGVIHMDS